MADIFVFLLSFTSVCKTSNPADPDDVAENEPAIGNIDNHDGESDQEDDNAEDDDLEDDAEAVPAVPLVLPSIQMMEGEIQMPADQHRFHLLPGKKHHFIFVNSPIAY